MLGMKIILSGTDSLGFAFADNDELYDRNIMIHTSYIPFREFSYLLGEVDIDTYIEYGGTLKKENISYDDPNYKDEEIAFKDIESTRKYIDTAICRNIQRSLRNSKVGSSFSSLRELYENNELTNVINRIVNDMNYHFLLSVIDNIFKSTDLYSSRQLLLKNKDETMQTVVYDIDYERVLKGLKNIIEVKEKEEREVEINVETLKQIKQYLYMLDLIKEVEIRHDNGLKEKRVIFTQPGMRYSITKALLYSLNQDEYFLSINEQSKRLVTELLLNDVKGRMLEDIVLLESTLTLRKDHTVFKYRCIDNKEIDMVIYNGNSNSFDIYEIKHSDAVSFESQTKYLRDEELLGRLTKEYGNLNHRRVLYRGESRTIEGIEYINVAEYLKGSVSYH